jgi:2'-deoxynucleoside 5'-phosphate N-hydrolase
MKVYCAAPIRGNTVLKETNLIIPGIVEASGHEALSEINIPSAKVLTDTEIFSRDLNWLEESSCVIAEVSSASSGVGFEIAYALYKMKIPVLALFRVDFLSTVSAMISGCTSELLTKKSYENINMLQLYIKEFLNYISGNLERKRIY